MGAQARRAAGRGCTGAEEIAPPQEAWHADAAFAETRQRLEGVEAQPSEQWWHEVHLDARA